MSLRKGHAAQDSAFIAAHAGGRAAHAWLLTGARGIGKAMFAQAAATWLVAHGGRGEELDLHVDADHPAARLIASGAHPEYLLLKRDVAPSKAKKADDGPVDEADLARNVTIEQVRGLIGRMRTRPAIAEHRAVIVDSIDDLERGAANAFLKTLEEPPERTTFLLVSHNPGRLLPTILSRCRTLRFDRLSDADLIGAMSAARPDLDAGAIEALVVLGQGSPGHALGFADTAGIAATGKMLEGIVQSGDPDNRLRVALAREFGAAGARARFDTMVAQAVSIANRAAQGRDPSAALGARERILAVGGRAVRNSEDLGAAAFAIGTGLCALAAHAHR